MKSFLIYLIRCYRQIRPDRAPCCRFTPSCSEYAIQAINTHGAAKGSLLAVWRILRCNPFSKGGPDPVPEAGRWSNKTHSPSHGSKKERNPE
ncbi:MAG: membrane protein insertion efficiency factor YidD [Clostridia bacterium]|nr:membrane protein insertion efficiency factor YidD [Clostridia bacterium]